VNALFGQMTTSPNPPDARLAAAIQLGWRVAELYALVDDTGEPANDTLLPSHGGLAREDQVELQLRAAAGDAHRAGVTSKQASLKALLDRGRAAPLSPEAAEDFRAQLRQCHIEVQKDLWALDESAGKAYELGNGLSDTYGRVCRAYRRGDEDEHATWKNVFEPLRLERLKRLLDDLQSRLNASSVAVVRAQLDTWSCEVPPRLAAGHVPAVQEVRDGLRRQTIIWRQLLTGDKEPEAYLDRNARSELRDELRHLIWRRYRRWVIPIGTVLFVIALVLPHLIRLYETGVVQTGLASAVFAGAGALGITKASVLLTVRGRLDQWSQLLWNRAVAQKVVDVTLSLNSVLPPVPTERKLRIGVPSRVTRHLKGSAVARRPSAAA
jgi:hypothetical protein